MTRNETIYETAKFYKDKNKSVHIKLQVFFPGQSSWLNGIISSIPDTKDRLVLEEEKNGEMLVFFERIIEIEQREERI